jgi:chorismate synthase
MPSGVEVSAEFINKNLIRRQSGYGRGGRMSIEKDVVKIKSGVRFGFSTGAPICLEIINKDWENWRKPMSTIPVNQADEEVISKKIENVRPGHADFAGALKYNFDDIRNVLERSSARETASRVAVGSVAQAFLKAFGVEITSNVIQVGAEKDINKLKEVVDKAREDGNSLGGAFEVVAKGLPVGLGSHVHWDRKLDGKIAGAIMSIPAIKSVSIGEGYKASELKGSEFHDEIFLENEKVVRKTNNAGGLEGGMTNGEPVVVKAIMKAIPTMEKPLNSINLYSKEPHVAHFERSDVCAIEAAAVVGESMLAIVLADAFLEKFGGDSLEEISINYKNYVARIGIK